MKEIVKYYSKVGTSYSLSTDEADEATLQRLGYLLMKSEYPGQPFIASENGTWEIDDIQAFIMLRNERNKRIANTDYLIMSDYPLSDDIKVAILAYRQLLRDLPALEGAPWDGGGEATPWPKMPDIK